MLSELTTWMAPNPVGAHDIVPDALCPRNRTVSKLKAGSGGEGDGTAASAVLGAPAEMKKRSIIGMPSIGRKAM